MDTVFSQQGRQKRKQIEKNWILFLQKQFLRQNFEAIVAMSGNSNGDKKIVIGFAMKFRSSGL